MSNKVIPNGNYKLAKKAGTVIYTSGITPKIDGKLMNTGKIPENFTTAEYKEIVEQAVINALHVAEKELSDTENLSGVLSMTVFVNASEHFTQHSVIADLASNYLHTVFGENGIGTRAAVGVSSLPGNAPLELQIIFIIS